MLHILHNNGLLRFQTKPQIHSRLLCYITSFFLVICQYFYVGFQFIKNKANNDADTLVFLLNIIENDQTFELKVENISNNWKM